MVSRQKNRSRNARKSLARKAAAQTPITKPSRLRVEQLEDRMLLSGGVTPFSHEWYIQKYGADPRLHLNVAPADPTHLEQAPGGPAGQLIPQLLPPGVAGPINMVPGSAVHAGPNQNLQYNINWFHDQGGEDHSRPDNGNDGSDRFTTLGGQNSVNDQPVQHVGQGHWRLSPDNGHESPELPGNPPIVLNNVLVNDPTADGPDINTQSETTVVAFGSNVIAGYNDSESFSGFGTHFTGYSLSTDGGNTFTDLGHLPDSSLGDAGDPVIARDNVTGRIYFSTLDFSTFTNIPVFRSDDGGATFQQPVNGSPLGGSSDLDKDWLTVDNFDGPGQGNVYVVVRDFGAGNGIYLTRSTDHGDTYGPSGGVFIVGGGNFNVQGPDVVVGPDHAVYVFWHDQSSGFGGPVSIMMRKSTDQGQTFGPAVTVANLNTTGVNGDLGFNFRSNAFPRVAVNPVNGALYLSYADFPNDGTGDRANIYFTQSLDGGATWSSPLKVNDDEGTTDQWQPAIAVKPNGSQVFIGFYDRRLDPTNTAIDTFGAVGDVDPTTGAITFEANFRISTESFPEAFGNDPVVNPSYMSDYDTADADNTYFYYTWGDNRLLNTTGVRHQADVRMAKILTGMTVVASTPSAGDFVSTPISDFVVTFSNPYDPATVDASDLTVNGIPADSVDQTDPSTLTFHYVVSPVTTEGPQTMAMAMDAVERASDQSPLQAFTSTFYYDTQRLEVVSTTPADGSAVTLPFEHLIVHFNEAVDPSSVAASNLSITQGTVTGASVVSGDPTSVDYTLSGITQEGTLTASIGANSLRDSDGNPGPADAFSASFVLDIGTVPYPTPLAAKKPAGSLIYDPSASGTIGFAGDTDSFTINLDPNQSITVLVTPDSGLQPTVDVYSPSSAHLGGAVAGAAGSVALLQTVPAVAAGTYTVTVGGAGGTTGSYTVQIILNAALENESNGGSDNNSLGTAQSLDSTFTSLGHGASRGAVLGQSDAGSFIGPDAYGYEGLAVAPEFIDISSTGTATLQGADDSSVGLSASDLGGFTFNFYGTTYNSLAYSSNGLITFDGFDSDFVNGDLMSNPSLAAIAPFWDDLENFGDSSSAVYWQVVGSKLIIQWSNTQFYASGGLITFEAVLDSADNTIQFNYLDLDAGRPDHDGGASATVGIKDAGSQGGNALRADFNSGPNAFVGTGLSTKFGVGIVSLTPDYYSFHLNKNESATIALSNLGAGSNSFELEDSSGTTLALGHGGAPNVSQVLNNFVSSTGGTYYVRVSGAGAPYSLLVTKNSDFDTEDNSTLAHAQSLQGGHNALGHLSPAFHGETFEEGNLNAYTFLGSNNASLTAEAAHDGSLGLSAASFTDWMFRNDAEVHVQRGDVIKGWIKSETTPGGRGYMGFGASEVGTMSVVMAANTGQFIIQDNSGYGFNVIGASPQSWEANHWYLFEIHWGLTGDITANLFDSDGATLLNTVSAHDDNFSSGGLAFRSFDSTKDFDTVGIGGPPSDIYSVQAAAGSTLVISTSTPGDGPGEPVNVLDPAINVYDPNGNLVASDDNSAGDGHNASLSYAVAVGGTYSIEVLPAAPGTDSAIGDYVLNVSGNRGKPAFKVVATNPADGAVVRSAPTYTVDFNDSILLPTLDASDLKVDGMAATGLTVVNDHEVIFTLPDLGGGDHIAHHVTIAAGALKDVQNTPISGFSSTFYIDTVAPRVIGTSIEEGATRASGNLSYTATFSEAMDASSLSAASFSLHGNYRNTDYSAASFAYNATDRKVTLNFTGLPDDSYTLTLNSGGFRDQVGFALDGEPHTPRPPSVPSGDGVEGGNFFVDFNLDTHGAQAYPTPLGPKPPAGSLVYDPEVVGVIAPAGDTDTYTLSVDPKQTITVDVVPDSHLQPTVQLYGPGHHLIGSASAGSAGAEALIQTVKTSSSATQTYSIVISGGGTQGLFHLRVTLNAALESEGHGGSSNDSIGTAQALDGSFIDLGQGASRGAVIGGIGSGGLSNGDVFVSARQGFFGGSIVHLDSQGNVVATITNPELNRGTVSDIELGQHNDFYVALDINADGFDGELVHFGDDGTFLGTVPLPTDGNPFGFYFYPFGFDAAADGTFWIGQLNSGNVVHVDASGNLLASYFVGDGFPVDAAVGPDGLVYVADGFSGYIYQLDPSTGNAPAIAYGGGLNGLNFNNDSTMWASDFYNGLNRFDTAGNFLQHVSDFSDVDPQGDPSGNVWATEYFFGAASKFDSGGNFITSAFVPGAIHLAVAGVDAPITAMPPDGGDFYSFHLDQGQVATIVVKGLDRTVPSIELDDASGNTLALGATSATNLDGEINNFVARSAGTYYVKVTGSAGHQYNLVVTRSVTFDQENNGTQATAQDVLANAQHGLPGSPPVAGGALGALSATGGVAVGANFEGLNFNDTSCGCLPPDNGFAVGAGYVMEAVNTAIRISDMAGNNLMTEELSSFFSPLGQGSGGDPYIVFDDIARRWYVTSFTGDFQGIEIAVSNDENPLDGFSLQNAYNFPGNEPDFNKIGFNADSIVIEDDLFGQNVVQIIAIDKSALLSSGQFVSYVYTYNDFNTDFDMEPAKMHGSQPGDPMYFVEEAGFGSGQAIRVVRLDNALSNSPQFTATDLAVAPYGEPPPASQPGGFGIATNSSFIVSVDWRNGVLAAAHNVAVPDDGFSTARARWYEISANGGTPTLLDQGTVDQGAGVNTFMPSVALDNAGNLGMTFIESSTSEFMSMYVSAHIAGSAPGSNSTPVAVRPGDETLQVSFRSGDYSNTVVDPDHPNVFWASNEYSPANSGSNIWATYVASFQPTPPVDDDWYNVSTSANDHLRISVSIPASGPGEFVNDLHATVALYDSGGNLVAGPTSGTLLYTVPAGGTYSVRVSSADGSQGEYVLHVLGNTGPLPSFHVTGTNPAAGALLQPPNSITVDFNHTIYLPSLDASDLQVTLDPGQPDEVSYTATGFTVVNDHEVIFYLPAQPISGNRVDNEIDIAAGAIEDVSGKGLDAFTEHYTTDNVGPIIIATSIEEGDVVPVGDVSYVATFNEPMNTSLSASDFALHGIYRNADYSPASFSFDGTGTVLTVTYAGLPDDAYTLTLFSGPGALQDLVGNAMDGEPHTPRPPSVPTGDGIPGGNFFVDFSADISTAAYPVPLGPKQPIGSIIYDPSVTDVISYVGDTDSFTLAVDPNQTITVLLHSATLQGTIELVDGGGNVIGSATGSAAGQDVVLQTVATDSSSTETYTIVIGGANGTLGLYKAQVILNAALQNEIHGGGSDDTLATAQDISGSSTPLANGADRLGVLGQYQGNDDLYSLHLSAGQSITVAAKIGPPPANVLGPRTDYGTDYGTEDIAFADFNNDGFPDMVTANLSGFDATVRLNHGDGTFGDPITVGYFSYYPYAVAVGDVNGDGNQDIVLSNFYGIYYGGSITVMLGDGAGDFSGPIGSSLGYNSIGVTLADFNGDGILDVAQTDYYDWLVNVGYGNGDGTFNYAGSYSTGAYPWNLTAGDLNGDGKADLAVANSYGAIYGTGNISLLFNNGDGTFGGPIGYSGAYDYTYGVAIGDLNNDGSPDVVATNFYSGVSVFLNDGAGNLGAPGNYSTATGANDVAIGDVNLDGNPDLAVANVYGWNVSLLPGHGDGSFGSAQNADAGSFSYPVAVAVADLNGDGAADVGTANNGNSTASIFLSQISEVEIQLLDSTGAIVATATTGPTNVDQIIDNYVAPSDGTYYIRVTGIGGAHRDYNIVATRGATFETESNDTAATAQDITGTGGVLGAIFKPSTLEVGTSFEGLSFNDTSCGCLPPDNGFAVGGGYVMEAVNTAIRISDMNGNVFLSEELSSFFAPLGGGGGGDPYIVFDDIAQRWYVVSLNNNFSAVDFAVSNDSNPLDGFTEMHEFTISGTSIFDFPKIGFNADAIVVTGDLFNQGEVGVVAIDKSTVLDQDNSTFTDYLYTKGGFPDNWDMEPAKMHGAAPGSPMYFVEEAGFANGFTQRVVRLDNALSNSPIFTDTDIAVDPYGFPVSATQPGGFTIATNFPWIVSVDWRDGVLAAAANVSVPDDGFTTVRARWYEFDTTGATPTLLDQGTIDQGPGVNSWMPSVALDANGDLGINFIESSPTEFMSVYVTAHLKGSAPGSNITPVAVRPGDGTLEISFRSGDYSNIVVDPDHPNTFWASNEYAPANSGSNIWATYVASFVLTPPQDEDWYSVSANEGDLLTYSTITPGDGSGEFVNDLDPHIELYDSDGNLVAVGTPGSDGRNETIEFAVSSSGQYYVRVTGDNGTQGEYFLSQSVETEAASAALQPAVVTPPALAAAIGSPLAAAPAAIAAPAVGKPATAISAPPSRQANGASPAALLAAGDIQKKSAAGTPSTHGQALASVLNAGILHGTPIADQVSSSKGSWSNAVDAAFVGVRKGNNNADLTDLVHFLASEQNSKPRQ